MATPQQKPLNGAGVSQMAGIMAQYANAGDKGVIGGYNGTFPLTTATQGNIYLLPSTGKYYRCKTDYNGNSLSLPNANFEDLSVVKNADKLENLFTIKSFALDWSKAQYNEDNGFYYINKYIDTPKKAQLLFISTPSDRFRKIQVVNYGKNYTFKLFESKNSNNFSSAVYYMEY